MLVSIRLDQKRVSDAVAAKYRIKVPPDPVAPVYAIRCEINARAKVWRGVFVPAIPILTLESFQLRCMESSRTLGKLE